MYECDMHVHSSFSPDAEHKPDEVFKIAHKKGLKAIVITDHNLTSGMDEALKAAKKYALNTCCGVEITTKYENTDIHILGYAEKFDQKILVKGLKRTVDGYNERAYEMVTKCRDLGVANINFTKLLKKRRHSFISRKDVAFEIAQKKNITVGEAFKIIRRGGPAFIAYGEWAMSPQEAVKMINEAQGVAVLAHPGDGIKRSDQPNQAMKIVYKLIDELSECGLFGLEAIYPTHSAATNREFSKLATQKNLFITGGSDWHGLNYTPEIKLGSSGIKYQEFIKFKKELL
ncbi:MAG: PHP domain-containing protein [Candidatus Berkelbacteria bacterium]|nr:PHP domain-containing protein [Candidatus Berkelbacteria bacterium]